MLKQHFVAAALAYTVVSGANAQQSGLKEGDARLIRYVFVGSLISNCNAKQMAAPENVGAPKTMLLAHCNCIANKLADRVSIDEMPDIGGDLAPQMVSKIKAVEVACIKQMSREWPEVGEKAQRLIEARANRKPVGESARQP
jgi:hypothetical protein